MFKITSARGSVDEKNIEKMSCKVTVPEVVLEEMTSRIVLKVTWKWCLGRTI